MTRTFLLYGFDPYRKNIRGLIICLTTQLYETAKTRTETSKMAANFRQKNTWRDEISDVKQSCGGTFINAKPANAVTVWTLLHGKTMETSWNDTFNNVKKPLSVWKGWCRENPALEVSIITSPYSSFIQLHRYEQRLRFTSLYFSPVSVSVRRRWSRHPTNGPMLR